MYNPFKVLLIWLYFQIIGVWKVLQEQIWDRHRRIKSSEIPALSGKTIVITGGNRGIGFEAVRRLIPFGCHIIIGCRRPIEAQKIIEKCVEITGKESDKLSENESGTFECIELNVASMSSVRKFASQIIERECSVNVLINNAGVMFGAYEITEDGLEKQMATNYFGHFMLTSLLLPVLKSSAGTSTTKSRIINVASCAHFAGSWFDLNDLNAKNYYSAYQTYANSKAAQIMFTYYLDQKLRAAECDTVNVNCIHPGVVNTGLFQHVGWARWFWCFPLLLFKTPQQGSDSIVYAASSLDIEGKGGLYLDNAHLASTSSFVNNVGYQAVLWQKTCDILNINDF